MPFTSRKWKLLAVVACFAVLAGLRLGWGGIVHHGDPVARNGVLDLRSWSPGWNASLPLNGEWTFYPGRYVQPGETSPNADARAIRVPGPWDGVFGSPYGYGTYRLEIRLPDNPEHGERKYAIRVSIVRTSSVLFVNGQRVGGSGVPGLTREETTPFVRPYVADFVINGDRAEVLIQAANFHYGSKGGIFDKISFGTYEAIERKNMLQIGQNALLMGLFLISGIFFLMLFLFRRHKRELLYFSLFFWMSLLFFLTHNERLLFWAFPNMNYQLQIKLQVMPTAVLFPILYAFVRWMYPQHARPWMTKFAIAGMFVLLAVDAFTPASVSARSEGILAVFDIVLIGVIVYLLMREFVRNTPDSVYSLIAVFCILIEGVFQGLFYLGVDAVQGLPPIEKIVFVLDMAFVIAKRFFAEVGEVETLSKRLLVADRLKNDFLASTSHEIRLPLHGMINIAQVMMNEENLGERDTERLSLLLATGRRLSHLLNDMLDLSKLNEGVLALESRPIDLRVLVSGVADVMRYLNAGRSVRFINRVDPSVLPATADEHRLMQVMFHLFHYAVKWGARGDVVVTAAMAGESRFVEVTVSAQGGKAEAGDAEATAADSAADFSLEMSRKLLGLHGSELAVMEMGTEAGADPVLAMVFRLPAGREEPAEVATAALPQWEEAVSGERDPAEGVWRHAVPDAPRVLLVDDDPVSLRFMFDTLVQEKLDVTAMTDGQEALRLIETEGGWDLIVLEAMLPYLSGYDLCRKIRERHTFYDLPVLFVTASMQPAYLLVGFDAGANDYVTKPFKAPEFLARTRILLRMKQSIRERLDIEMALIQAQIKPHFLYNTLNTIASLSEIDPDRTRDLLADFGSYLQSSFDLRNLDRKVPFDQEWKLVQSYLNIEKARFGSRIQLTVSLPDSVSLSLPPLTIQPIVENALRHGVLKRVEGGRVHIEIKEAAGYVRISVRDNGVGIPPTKKASILEGTYRSGIGLVNVDRRLKNAYGHGLSIESLEGEGTEVSFRIPLPQGREETA
ncbi:response regulator [Cohnella candidum]|uniref:histidine kinase n=1 Tax=Cohnella candidum TaxID=2674991 RepID=A0A3G3K056_9BACL|nr:response regulator [Cohnella candidum]AYQ73772.1 response regulator [Cohnella candidum]